MSSLAILSLYSMTKNYGGILNDLYQILWPPNGW